MGTKIKRDHDKLYLRENRKNTPKESFKFVLHHCKKFLDRFDSADVLDVGCATGDFLYFMLGKYPHFNFTGLDIMPELITRARKEVPAANFLTGDICNQKTLPTRKFDAIFLIGVHSIFDNLDWGKNILYLVSNRGRAYIFGLMNPEDVDVLVKTRLSNQKNYWQPGWNMFSKKTISEYFKNLGAKTVFHEFQIGIDLARHKNDPLRSWTFKLANNKRLVVNGTQLLYQCSLMEVIPPKWSPS